jgi:adenine phosphoribosyltransferase
MSGVVSLLRRYVRWETQSKTDVYPLVEEPSVRAELIDEAVKRVDTDVDYVAGIETTGFVFASFIAARLNKGFLPVRRKEKWPYEEHELLTASCNDYSDTEKTFAVRRDSVDDASVLLVDDWIETGAQCRCAQRLIRRCGGTVNEVFVLVDEAGEDDLVTSLAVLD